MFKNKVVVTGMGVVSPIGNTLTEFSTNLFNGISATQRLDDIGYSGYIGAPVKEKVKNLLSPFEENDKINRSTVFALKAFEDALAHSKLKVYDKYLEDACIILGNSMSFEINEQLYKKMFELFNQKSFRSTSNLNFNQLLDEKLYTYNDFKYQLCSYNPAASIAGLINCRGFVSTISNACQSSTLSILKGYEQIKSGFSDIAIVGGSEAMLNVEGLAIFSALGVLSTNTEAEKASKPFDRNRDGFVLGEGAGLLILELESSALKRGANILAEIVGGASMVDTAHVTTPDTSGEKISELLNDALVNCEIQKEDVSYINAHGTGTYYNDISETNGIKKTFGEKAYEIPISSNKSMFGHLLAAAGAVEAISSILTIQSSNIPPTINYFEPDKDCDLDYVPNISRKKEVDCIISNSFGFGGQNASIILKKYGAN